MTGRSTVAALLCLAGWLGSGGLAPAASAPVGPQEGAAMSHARGSFEVDVKPLPADEKVEGLEVGRYAIHKRFAGGLEGTSVAEMMATRGETGSGGYVAVERVSGTLDGRRGSFLLLHQGTMQQGGDVQIRVVVIPDSATDQLAGLAGSMEITVAEDGHFYDLEYSLPVP